MSVESISRVLHKCDLKGTAKLVLVGIANHDGDGGAWPSVETLAMYASVTTRNVQKAINDLVDGGWVTVEPNAGGTKNTRDDRRPNLYRINWTRLGYGVSDPTSRNGHGVSDATPRGVASDADGVSDATPEPSSEPSIEPSNLFGAALASQDKPKREHEIMWDIICEEIGITPGEVTKAARGGLNQAIKQIRDAGGTPEQVRDRCRELRARFDGPISASALAKWWPTLGQAMRSNGNRRQTATGRTASAFDSVRSELANIESNGRGRRAITS